MPRGVLLLIADDWSPIAGCYGDAVIRTPHIDALARRATVFDHAFCTTPSCAASRACILTGQHSHTNGMYGLSHGVHGFRAHADARSIPAVLRDADIPAGLIGKSHVVPREVFPFIEGSGSGLGGGGDAWSAASLAQRADAMLVGFGDQPFYLHVASMYPHRRRAGEGEQGFPASAHAEEFSDSHFRYDPADVPVPPWLPDVPEVRRDLADYYGYITRYDHFVGELLRSLDASGRADDTLVIVMTDHGMPFPGAKASNFDTGHRCPLLISRPGGTGLRCDAMVNWLDLAPTIYDWLGVDASSVPKDLPGRSLLPILDTPSPEGWEHTFFSHQLHEISNYFPYRVMRGRRFKYVRNLARQLPLPLASDLHRSPTWQAVLESRLTMMGARPTSRVLHHDREALFDIHADPLEVHNLIADPAFREVADQMRRATLEMRVATRDPWLEQSRQEGELEDSIAHETS